MRRVDLLFGISYSDDIPKTDDYWDAYWEITRTVKMRFDDEGIAIPFPQRDVHLIQT